MKKNFDDLVDQSLVNIENDRKDAKELLDDLWSIMGSGSDKHKECGFILSKYLEVLQKSNEQLVKLASLLQKVDNEHNILSEETRNNIFDELVKQEKPKEEKKKK